MKKIIKSKRFWFWVLIIAFTVGLNVLNRYVTEKYIQRSVDKAYVDGFEKGVKSVELKDLCLEPEKKGMGTDFERGFGYDIVECKVNLHDWKQDWEFEGSWDKCDENGENCKPFVEDGIYLEGNAISI